MTRDPFSDGPELVPPAELLRLRDRLRGEPNPATRAQHLVRAAAVAREHPIVHPLSRFATRGVRIAAAAVASVVITSGLAGAQLLPDPAQRLLSNVSDRFAPDVPAPTTTEAPSDPPASHDGGSGLVPAVADPTSTTEGGSSGPATTAVPPVSATSSTLPGPTGPGSPTDPTDPGPTDPSTTTSSTTSTTVDPSSTTTTTDPSTTTTTDPGTSTTTTSVAPSP